MIMKRDAPETDDVDLLRPRDVARRIGCSESHVRRLINIGELTVIDISVPGSSSTKYRVTHESLADYIARRTDGGRAAAQ